MSKFEERHVHRRFRSVAADHATRVALTFRSGDAWHDWTYLTLAERAADVTSQLATSGAVAGSAIGLVAHRGPGTIAAMLGILGQGAHYVPLDPGLPAARTDDLIAGARVSHVVDAGPAIDTDPHFTITPTGSASQPASFAPNAGTESPEDVVYVMFTSGSTGRPKAVLIPHRGVTRLVSGQDYAKFGPDRVFLQAAPLSFDASTFEIWGALLHGARCVLYPTGTLPTAEGLRAVISAQGVTTAWLTASLFHALVDHDARCLAGIEDLLVGGEAVSPSHVVQAMNSLPDVRITNGYGPTENTTFSTCHSVPRDLSPTVARVPIGRSIRGTQTVIVDEHLKPVAPGTEGELLVMGDGLALGYLGEPELTRRQFVEIACKDGVSRRAYRTGDRVVELEQGLLDFRGRSDDQVKIHGYRIEPHEVGTAIGRLNGVSQCRVVVRRDATGQSRLVAFVVLDKSSTIAEVRRAMTKVLPAYMVPHQVHALADLPLNANGKLAADALPVAPPTAITSSRRSPQIAMVEEAWTEVLGRAPETPDTNFFEAGGRSLDAIRLLDLFERKLDLALDPTFPFEFPTPRRQAARLAALLAT